MTGRCLAAAAILAACVACGDVERVASEAPTTSASPPPGAYPTIPRVVLTADRPATIYYTVDGSDPTTESESAIGRVEITDAEDGTPVKYFAVGAGGDAEAIQEATYTLGPALAPVSNLQVEATSSSGAEVSWDAPEGDTADGVLVVRLYGAPQQPRAGVELTAGESALGGEVVYRGTDTSFTDEGLVPGIAMYAVYAVDLADNYSTPTVGVAELPVPRQRITMTIDTHDGIANQEITIDGAPPDIGLVAYVHGDSLSTSPHIAMTLTNDTSRVLYNPKLVVRRAQVADVDIPVASFETYGLGGGPVDGTLADGGDSFFWLEPVPNGWAPGAQRQLLLIINGQTADTTIDLVLDVVPGRMLVGLAHPTDDRTQAAQLFDPSVKLAVGFLSMSASGPGNRFSYRRGAFSLDGRRLYLAAQNSPVITTVDLVTMGETQTFHVTGEHAKGHVRQVGLGRDGRTLYALFVDGAHHYHFGSPPDASITPIHVELVAIDTVDWKETGRVRLATRTGADDYGLRGRMFDVSPDGTLAAIPVIGMQSADPLDEDSAEDKGSLHLVDLASMTEVDTDADRDGVQPIAFDAIPLKGGGEGETVVVNPGAACFVGDRRVLVATSVDLPNPPNDAITARADVVVDVDLESYEPLAVVTGTKMNRCVRSGGDGLLVGGAGATALLRYDLGDQETGNTGYNPAAGATMSVVQDGDDHVLVSDSGNTLAHVSLDTGVADWTLPTIVLRDWLAYTPF
jgi:hypothetical protein